MQIILASAKIMRENVSRTLQVPPATPLFQSEAETLSSQMSVFSEQTLSEMLSCSVQIASVNRQRYLSFGSDETPILPSILAYYGQAYKHLVAESLSDSDLDYSNSHLWITSFMYGLLRPMDGINNYRMEGGIKLPCTDSKTVFDFWKPLVTDVLIESVKMDGGILIHLSTEEYQALFDWKKVCNSVIVIQPQFLVNQKGKLKTQAVWAKTCRGAMTRWIITNRIDDPSLLRGFSYEGFEYSEELSGDQSPVFVRQ